MMTNLMSDIRFAVRHLSRNRGAALLTVLTLAVGIGANSAIFALVHGILFRSLPFPDPDQIVTVTRVAEKEDHDSHAPGNYMDLRREQRVFTSLAAYRQDAFDLTGGEGDAERVSGAQVTSEFFDVFGMPAQEGRTITARRDDPKGNRVIVLSHGLWLRRFAGDPAVVGRTIRVNRELYTVLGVMPASFSYPGTSEAWILATDLVPSPPLAVNGDLLAVRDASYLEVVARLTPHTTLAQARAAMGTLGRELERRYPASNAGEGLGILELRDRMTRELRTGLLVLLGAVGFVLLVACANVAGLMLARAAGRTQELAVRSALGAERQRLVCQLLVESGVVGIAGSVIGLLLAMWGVTGLVAVLPADVPRLTEVRLDTTVTLFTLGLGFLTAIVSGIVPALMASSAGVTAGLRVGDRHAARRPGRAMSALVVIEVALGVVLTVGAGLMVRSLLQLQAVDPGYKTENVIRVSLPLPQSRYGTVDRQSEFYVHLLDRLAADPRTRTAAVMYPLPMNGAQARITFAVEGQPVEVGRQPPSASLTWVSPGSFNVLGVPLRQGRDFDAHDVMNLPLVAVVSEDAAARFWPGSDPVGKRLNLGDQNEPMWCTIIGVVGNTRTASLATPSSPMFYLVQTQFPVPTMALVIRSTAGLGPVASAVRAAVRELDAELPVGTVSPLADLMARSVQGPRFRTTLIAMFAIAALLLAALGVYGLMSYMVSQRNRELGIRLALGARPGQIVFEIVCDGLELAAMGLGIGIPAALALARLIGTQLYDVRAADPATLAAVALILLATATAGSWLPARRVKRIDPLTALRAE
jgi:putative ABC transport system permease protein